MLETWLMGGGLVAALGAAASDLRRRHIPNRLCYGALALALSGRALAGGARGFEAGALGVLVGGGALLIVFLLGGLGGGDVKLMAALGACAGVAHVVGLLVATAMAGAALVLLLALRQQLQRRLRRGLKRRTGLQPRRRPDAAAPDALTVPYAVAIAAGASCLWLNLMLRG